MAGQGKRQYGFGKMRLAKIGITIGLILFANPLPAESIVVQPEAVISNFTVDNTGTATLTYTYPIGSFTRVLRSLELGDAADWRAFSTSTQSMGTGVLQATFSIRQSGRYHYRVTIE